MSRIKGISGVELDGSVLLTEIDFTSLSSADWTGETSVSLDGKTWDIQNGGNANTFGPDGSTLVLHPKGTGVCDWYGAKQDTPALAIDLSDLDSSLTDSSRYAVQIITPGFQSPAGNYARMLFGFYNTAAKTKGYSPLFGTYHNGVDAIYFFLGAAEETGDSSAGFTGSEQTYWVYLESSGLWTCYTSDSQDATVDGGTKRGTLWASVTGPNMRGRGADLSTGLLTKPSTARVVLTAAGYHAVSTGPSNNIDSLRVWRLSDN
jgi:hypothetical protein|tara:strand:+ start:1876 stop:2661 length:786 start_codon:yes stop_codon:yes gene_type:complete